MDYTQPNFYKFSEDSIILSQIVCDSIEMEQRPFHLLDVGCGCGVIGIEVMRKIESYKDSSLTLLEKQREFLPYIQKNRSQFLSFDLEVQILNQDFLNFKSQGLFTHIVSNPPYFLEGRGRVSPNAQRQGCRSWDALSALGFLKHFASICQAHRAKGFICGRRELQSLLDEAGIPHKVLRARKETAFYLLL